MLPIIMDKVWPEFVLCFSSVFVKFILFYNLNCTCICRLFVHCFLLFEALIEDGHVVKWVASWNKVFIIIIIIIIIINIIIIITVLC